LELGRFNPVLNNWTINLVVPRKSTVKQKTVWWETRHDAGTHGTTLLQKLLGKSRQFSFPKSLYLVRDSLDVVVRNRPEALILDFFAGSGTTAHAVALLNEVDGGRRRSILVTNNEVESKLADSLIKKNVLPGSSEYEAYGIFWNVTKPRLEAALTGKRRDGKDVPGNYIDKSKLSRGLAENIEFFELTYEDPDRVRLGEDFAAVAPLLWLMAGAEGPRIDKITGTWAVPAAGRYGVLFDADAWPAFVEGLRSNAVATHAFIVTDSDAVFQRVVADLPATITPVRLYESYLRSFAINTGVRS
jgi:adenine-specific DNA-methyltransferase